MLFFFLYPSLSLLLSSNRIYERIFTLFYFSNWFFFLSNLININTTWRRKNKKYCFIFSSFWMNICMYMLLFNNLLYFFRKWKKFVYACSGLFVIAWIHIYVTVIVIKIIIIIFFFDLKWSILWKINSISLQIHMYIALIIFIWRIYYYFC